MAFPMLWLTASSFFFLASARRVDQGFSTTGPKYCEITRAASKVKFAVDVDQCSERGNCNRFANAAHLPELFINYKGERTDKQKFDSCVCTFANGQEPETELVKFMPYGGGCDAYACWSKYRDIVNRFSGNPKAEHPDNEWSGRCTDTYPTTSSVPSAESILRAAIKASGNQMNYAEIWRSGLLATPKQLGIEEAMRHQPAENITNRWRTAVQQGKEKSKKKGSRMEPMTHLDAALVPTLFWELSPSGGKVKATAVRDRFAPQLEQMGLDVSHLLVEAGLDSGKGEVTFDGFKKFIKVLQKAKTKKQADDEQAKMEQAAAKEVGVGTGKKATGQVTLSSEALQAPNEEDLAQLSSTSETVADALELQIALEQKLASMLLNSQTILDIQHKDRADMLARLQTLAGNFDAMAIGLGKNFATIKVLQDVTHLNALSQEEQQQLGESFLGAVGMQADTVTKLQSMRDGTESAHKAAQMGTQHNNEVKAALLVIQSQLSEMKYSLVQVRDVIVQAAVVLASKMPPSSPSK